MVVLDTQKDWQWWIDTWQYVLDACRIEPSDRIMMAFSFGPFIGFWSAHDACLQRGCMVIPCGGMSTAARIDFIQSAKPSVLFSTPTYAMHMANDASKRGIDLRSSSIRQVFVAGEPGGCVPAIRKRIEDAYGAKLMDHAGATEVGPWGVGTADGTSLHVIESEFIAEYLPTKSNPRNLRSPAETEPDAVFELVITSLGRVGAPVLRYRTGDLVRPYESKDPECRFMCLAGGVLGRADDMFVVRGVNVFPSSVDSIVRTFDSVFEYRLIVDRIEDMDQLMLQIELDSKADDPHVVETRLAERLAIQLNLRIDVRSVPPGTLAPGEGKAKRFIDRRKLTAG
jgi:phenylacetate-CoA ligase